MNGKVVNPFERPEPGRKLPIREVVPHTSGRQHAQVAESGEDRPRSIGTDRAETATDNFDGTIVVGNGVEFKGEIWSCARLVIAGDAEGTFIASDVTIVEGGTVRADIEAERAEIRGAATGQLVASDHVTMGRTSCFDGELLYGQLSLEIGCQLTGVLSNRFASNEQSEAENLLAQHTRKD